MSIILAVAAAAQDVVPTVVNPVVITKTVAVPTTSHFFQLAEIVKYLGYGAGLSLIHAVVNNRFGLPKTLNKILPVVYSVFVTVATLIVAGSLNWSDWFQVFTQVLTGSVAFYAIVTLVTPTPVPSSTTIEDLPTVEAV